MILSKRKNGRSELFSRAFCFLFVGILTILTALMPVSTYALSSALFPEYSQADIYFYDPSAGALGCYSGNLSGDTMMAKIVSYLKGNNPTGFVLSDNGTAGILANFWGESGFNAFRFEGDSPSGPGYGIAQFTDPNSPSSIDRSPILPFLRSDSRTSSYFNTYFDVKYSEYDTETGFPIESVPMEVIDAWLEVQLDYFFDSSSEFENTKVGSYRDLGGSMGLDYIPDSMNVHEAMNIAQTPEDAARVFVWIMERPGDKSGASETRGKEAKKWLEYVQTISSNGGSNDRASTSSDGDKVTIIGDLITVGSENEIKKVLPKADIYARDDMSFSDGISVIKELINSNKLGDVIIYELGMDGNVTEEMVNEVINLVGKSRKIVFSNTSEYLGLNNILKNAANNNDNVEVLDWKGAVEGKETQYLSGSGVNEEGATLFATIVKNTVDDLKNAIPTCVSGAVEGGLTEEQAQAIADYYNDDSIVSSERFYESTKENCVAFSQFFVEDLTNLDTSGLGWPDGKNVVGSIATRGVVTGSEPRPFSVFSISDGESGHTGVVVALDGDKMITIEAMWKKSRAKVYVRDLNDPYFADAEYAYFEDNLNQSLLSQILGGNY